MALARFFCLTGAVIVFCCTTAAQADTADSWRLLQGRVPFQTCKLEELRTAIANPNGIASCEFVKPTHKSDLANERGKHYVRADQFSLKVHANHLVLTHLSEIREPSRFSNGYTFESEGWDRNGCGQHDLFATVMLSLVGITAKIVGSKCEFMEEPTLWGSISSFSTMSSNNRTTTITVPKSLLKLRGGKPTSEAKISIAPKPVAKSFNKPDINRVVVPSAKPDTNPLAESDAVRAANLEQQRITRAKIAATDAKVRSQQEAYAAQQARYRAEVAARNAEIARINAETVQKKVAWEADVAACKAGDISKCAKPSAKIAMIEAVVVCPINATKLFGESTCYGPFQNTLSDHRKAYDVSLACGSSQRPVRDMGTVGTYHVWGCEFGLNPTKPGSPNIDQAVRFGLNLPDRRTYNCLASIAGFCRTP